MPLSSVKLNEDDHNINTEQTTATGISAFLGKLWKMVEDPKTNHLICWGKTGNTFVIKNQIDFAKIILPNYYKHNNIASFIRQLNMYGFHKIISTTSGTLDSSDNDEIEFTHPCFVRGHSYLLEQIKRKMNTPKENFPKRDNPEQFNESIIKVLNDIQNLKGKQEYLGSQLSNVKRENEILWRELTLLRQKHAAQQNILNKLIRFLVSLAQPSNRGIVKRRLTPLMIKDSASTSKWKEEPIIEDGDHVYTMKKRNESASPGPTIHEIQPTEILENVQVIEAPVMEVTADTPVLVESEVIGTTNPVLRRVEAIPVSSQSIATPLFLPSTSKGNKNKLRTYYIASSDPRPTQYIISKPKSPDYLLPDSPEDSLMELVQEAAVSSNNGDYVTLVAEDGNEIITGDLQNATIIQHSPELFTSNKNVYKKRSNRKYVRKINSSPQKSNKRPKVSCQSSSVDYKKKKCSPMPQSKRDNILTSDDFLIEISPNTSVVEPIIEINESVSEKSKHINSEVLNTTQNDSNQTENIISIEDLINIPLSSDTESTKTVQVSSNVKNQNKLKKNLNLSSTSNVNSPLEKNSENLIFNVENNSAELLNKEIDETVNEISKHSNDLLMKEINECIDNAPNMKIACTDNTSARSCVEDLSMQLDVMQSDINSLKELMQNEGLTVDVNTLLGIFNEDPLNYNLSDSSTEFHKLTDDKIMGNELISAPSMLDFSDFFSQNDLSQPSSPLNTIDNEYCNLNTPQIDRRVDETTSTHSSSDKKSKSK